MTEPVTAAQNTPDPAPQAPAPAKPAAAKPAAKAAAKPVAAKGSTKAPAKAPAVKGSTKAADKAPAKAAATKAPASKAPASKTPAKAEATKATASKDTKATAPDKAEAKAEAPVMEPIKPGKDSWSRIATQINGSRSVNELVKKAGLSNWNVTPEGVSVMVPIGVCIDCERPLGELHTKECPMLELPEPDVRVVKDSTCVPVPMFDSYGLVRVNPDSEFGFDVIGHTKSDRVPVPMETRAEMLASIMKDTKAKTGPAGPLWEGKAAFASIRLPEPVLVGGKDPVEIRMVLINSYVPGRKSRVIISPVRVATQTVFPFESMKVPNVLELEAFGDKDVRITETSDALALLNAYTEWFKETADKLLAQTMTKEEFSKLKNELFPYSDSAPAPKRKRQQWCHTAMDMLFNGTVNITAAIKGTRYAAQVAVSTVLEHLDPGNDGELDPIVRAMDMLFSTKTDAHTAFRMLCNGLK